MHDITNVAERVQAVVAEALEVDRGKVTPETLRSELTEWDSLGHLRLMMALEAEFGIHFRTEELGVPASISELCALVERTAGGE